MSNTISVDIQGEEDVLRMLSELNSRAMFKVADEGMKKANKYVRTRARQMAPRSSKTGSAKKRSKKQRESADWETPLHKTIKSKIHKSKDGSVGVIGPSWPKGNKAYFNLSERGRQVVYWGKRQGTTYKQEDWLKKSLDESRDAVRGIFFEGIREAVKEVDRG